MKKVVVFSKKKGQFIKIDLRPVNVSPDIAESIGMSNADQGGDPPG